MLRNLILTAALAAATVTGVALTPTTAAAQPPIQRDFGGHNGHHDRYRFEVLVRHGDHWHSHGKYRDRDDAQRAARHLRQQGFRVKIDDC